jgi:hypothetical protein
MANQVYQSTMQPYKQNPQGDFWGGRSEFTEQVPLMSQQQMGLQNNLMQRGYNGLDQFDFAPIEAEARKGFEQKTLPSIAERFRGLGATGGSGYQQMMRSSATDLEGQLAAMKQNYNLKRQPMFQDMMNMGLRPQFENVMHEAEPGMAQTLLPLIGKGLELYATGGMSGIGDLLGLLNNMSQSNNGWSQQSKQNTMFAPGNYSRGSQNFNIGSNRQFGQWL